MKWRLGTRCERQGGGEEEGIKKESLFMTTQSLASRVFFLLSNSLGRQGKERERERAAVTTQPAFLKSGGGGGAA